MAEWFKDWFNTEEYLQVYSHRDLEDAKKLVDLIVKNVSVEKNAKVLDFACGAGRHSILFAQKGLDVTGVDLSENLLKLAKQSARENGLDINFINSDVRHFAINTKFDLIVSLFTSFGYFESDKENFDFFHKVFHYLNKSGYFVIDYLNKNYVEKNLKPETLLETDEGLVIQKRKIENDRVVKEISIDKNGSSKKYFESVKMYDDFIMKDELVKTGFTIKHVFGDFSGNDFEKENSKRLIIIAQK